MDHKKRQAAGRSQTSSRVDGEPDEMTKKLVTSKSLESVGPSQVALKK